MVLYTYETLLKFTAISEDFQVWLLYFLVARKLESQKELLEHDNFLPELYCWIMIHRDESIGFEDRTELEWTFSLSIVNGTMGELFDSFYKIIQ